MTTDTSGFFILILNRYNIKPKLSGHWFFFTTQLSQSGQSDCSMVLNLKCRIFHAVGDIYVISQNAGNRLICSCPLSSHCCC